MILVQCSGWKYNHYMVLSRELSGYVMSSHIAVYGSAGSDCQSCSWSAQQRKCFFLRPRSSLRTWSRETGSAVPSRVILLILHTQTDLVLTHGIPRAFHTQAESGAYSRDFSRFPRRHSFIFTATRHRASPEFIKSRNGVPMAFTAESPPARGQ